MDATEVVEAAAVEEGQELVRSAAAPATLFRTDEPGEVLARAQSTADVLMPVVREKGLVVQIQGREHLRVEAWTTLGAMLGVTPLCVWTRPVEGGWEARVEARTLDGRTIGAAEAECLRTERRWKEADDYAVRSMSQTRATSKALASVLRFVATLAGASGTPAEEMSGERREDPKPKGDPLPTARVNEIGQAIGRIGIHFDRLCTLFVEVGAVVPRINRSDSLRKALTAMSPEQADKLAALLNQVADRG